MFCYWNSWMILLVTDMGFLSVMNFAKFMLQLQFRGGGTILKNCLLFGSRNVPFYCGRILVLYRSEWKGGNHFGNVLFVCGKSVELLLKVISGWRQCPDAVTLSGGFSLFLTTFSQWPEQLPMQSFRGTSGSPWTWVGQKELRLYIHEPLTEI